MLPVGNNVTDRLTSCSLGKWPGESIEIINEALEKRWRQIFFFFTDGSDTFCLMPPVQNAIREFVIK